MVTIETLKSAGIGVDDSGTVTRGFIVTELGFQPATAVRDWLSDTETLLEVVTTEGTFNVPANKLDWDTALKVRPNLDAFPQYTQPKQGAVRLLEGKHLVKYIAPIKADSSCIIKDTDNDLHEVDEQLLTKVPTSVAKALGLIEEYKISCPYDLVAALLQNELLK